jgi:hypothetical protein
MKLSPGLLGGFAALAFAASLAQADAPPVDSACQQASPSAAFCIGLDKLADAAATECRAAGAVPDQDCVLPAGQRVIRQDIDGYMRSWAHRTLAFQYRLGDSLPLGQAQWIGTHNSYNSFFYGPTPSRMDSNQQLTIAQQLEIDVRAIEIDPHWLPAANGNLGQVVICHGRPSSEENFGCTTEDPMTTVLAEIDGWLNAHPRQVILLYLDDNLSSAESYTEAAQELETGLVGSDGHSLIYKPTADEVGTGACAQLPLNLSRDDVLAAHQQVVVVAADCVAGWKADVFSWGQDEVESGSTPGFKAYPACDASYGPQVYATHLVRYFEDSTFVSAVTSPTQTPAQDAANSLSPRDVGWMTDCGVNLFGFDQLLPDDGRLAATIWSWAPGEPRRRDGRCSFESGDGRWYTGDCAAERPAACRTADGSWSLTAPVSFADAVSACAAQASTFSLPRSGLQSSQLHTVLGGGDAWLDLQLPARSLH